MAISILSLITLILKIGLEIFQQVMSDKAKLKKLIDDKNKLEDHIYTIAQKTLTKMQKNLKEDSTDDMESAMDKE